MKAKLGLGVVSVVASMVSVVLAAGALTGSFAQVTPAIPDGAVSGVAINDAGQVVGGAAFADGTHAFVRAPDGTYTELAALPGDTSSWAASINAGGDVVGGSGGSAVRWSGGGAPVDLGSLPGETSMNAVDISDTGWIVGNGSVTSQAWYIDPSIGTVTLIVPVAGATITQVRAVNADGVAVGRVMVAGEFVPFTWNAVDGMTLLPEPPGETGFEPDDINASGQIIGHVFHFDPTNSTYTAYLLGADGFEQLSVSGYDSALPHSISDTGWVVGWVSDAGADRVPAAWDLIGGDATAYPPFNGAAFTNEFNAVNNSGLAVGISREGDDFDRTYVGQIGHDPDLPIEPTQSTTTVAPTSPASPAVPVAASPTYTG